MYSRGQGFYFGPRAGGKVFGFDDNKKTNKQFTESFNRLALQETSGPWRFPNIGLIKLSSTLFEPPSSTNCRSNLLHKTEVSRWMFQLEWFLMTSTFEFRFLSQLKNIFKLHQNIARRVLAAFKHEATCTVRVSNILLEKCIRYHEHYS